jgi:hypothetical protein
VLFPILALLILHFSALRYQDLPVDIVQHVAVLLDIGLLIWFSGRLRETSDWPDELPLDNERFRRVIRILSLISILQIFLYTLASTPLNPEIFKIKEVAAYWLLHAAAFLDVAGLIWFYWQLKGQAASVRPALRTLRREFLIALPVLVGVIEGWMLNIAQPGDVPVVTDSALSVLEQPLEHYSFCPLGGCRHLVLANHFLTGEIWDKATVVELRAGVLKYRTGEDGRALSVKSHQEGCLASKTIYPPECLIGRTETFRQLGALEGISL